MPSTHTFIASVSALGRRPRQKHFLPAAGRVEIIRINILSEHDVVVEVKKFAADACSEHACHALQVSHI